MKNIFIIFFFFFVSFQLISEAQTFKVIERRELIFPESGEHLFPRFSTNDSVIYCTRANYKGIEAYNILSKEWKEITAEPGAGYEYQFSDNGSKIFYRTDTYRDGRKYSDIKSIDFQSNKIEIIENGKRNLSTPKILTSGDCIYKSESNISIKNKQKNTLPLSAAQKDTALFYDDNNLTLLIKGERRVFNPLGAGSYLWSSLSPDKSKVLFTFMGKGTYVTDIKGTILLSLGYANAPKWSSDGKWIAYMEDRDDGVKVISSEIFLISVDGKEKIQVTETKDMHEQFPEWSPNMKALICRTSDGKIILLNLEKKL